MAHLRVYEPLATVDEPERRALSRRMVAGGGGVAHALAHERAGWLVADLAGRLPDASPAVLVLQPEEVPGGTHRAVGPGPLVCSWDGRRRAAAALIGAAERYPVLLLRSAGIDPQAQARARAVLRERPDRPTHVLSSTWGVPLGWFALVDPDARQVLSDDGLRRPVWRSTVAEATVRASRAQRACETLGPASPVTVLPDVLRWFSRFPAGCAVELDYAGLGPLLDTAALAADPSCVAVHEVIALLERGEVQRVDERLEHVRRFWARVRSWEHAN